MRAPATLAETGARMSADGLGTGFARGGVLWCAGGNDDEQPGDPVRGQSGGDAHDLSDRPRRLAGSKLPWVDLNGDAEDHAEQVVDMFDLD
jgi:hypothetical protein